MPVSGGLRKTVARSPVSSADPTSNRCWAAGDSRETRSAKMRSTLRPSGNGSGNAAIPARCAAVSIAGSSNNASGLPVVLVTSWSRTRSASPGAFLQEVPQPPRAQGQPDAVRKSSGGEVALVIVPRAKQHHNTLGL